VRPFRIPGLDAGPRRAQSNATVAEAGGAAEQPYIQQLSRRDFLKTGGVFVIGVSLSASLVGCGGEASPPR
jgi:hypothetical protein